MKIYNTQAEVDKDIVNNTLTVQGDVTFTFNLKMEASLVVEAGNIKAGDIDAWDIKARNIEAGDIVAEDIVAGNIEAGDIVAEDIKAEDIVAWNIEAGDIVAEDIVAEDIVAWNIEAGDIKAGDITFWSVAYARVSFVCKSITGRRENSKYFCLDNEIVYIKE